MWRRSREARLHAVPQEFTGWRKSGPKRSRRSQDVPVGAEHAAHGFLPVAQVKTPERVDDRGAQSVVLASLGAAGDLLLVGAGHARFDVGAGAERADLVFALELAAALRGRVAHGR